MGFKFDFIKASLLIESNKCKRPNAEYPSSIYINANDYTSQTNPDRDTERTACVGEVDCARADDEVAQDAAGVARAGALDR